MSADVAKNYWSQDYMTFSFLLDKIEKSITQAFTTSEAQLDIFTYIESQVFLEELKNEVSQQTRLTIELCKNIVQDVTDIGAIFDHAQEIHQYRVIIEKKMDNFSRKIPEHFMAPAKLWAEYQLVLNFSLHDYQKYNDIYTNKYSKYEKHFRAPNLTQENLYQENNAFLLLSGQKLDNGQVLFCNKALEDLCGTKLESILGSHVSSLFTSSLQAPFADIFRHLFESGKMSILNQTTRAFLKHRNGYIVEVDFYLRIHPYITENLYLNMLIRPVPSENEYLFLRQNGDIEGATRNLWKKLNLSAGSKTSSATTTIINIKALSTELSKVNEAFNIVGRQQLVAKTVIDSPKLTLDTVYAKKRNFSDAINKSGYFITKNRAAEIHSQYSSDSQKVKIWPLKTTLSISRESLYDCQISILNYGSVSMKLLRLHEISDQENDDSSPKRRKSIHASPRRGFNFPQQAAKNTSFSSMGDEMENVDCEEVKQTEQIITEWRNTLLTTTEGNLISPRTNRSQVQLLTPRGEEKPILSLLHLPDSDTVTPKKLKLKKMKSQHSGNPLSQALTETKLHKTFQKAISVKSYPRILKALFSVFYIILLLSSSSLIAIKFYSDATYNDLAVKKDMLGYAQLRTFYVIRIQTTCRGAGLQIAGALVADYAAFKKISELVEVSHTWIDNLVDANQLIIQNMNYLENDIKVKLFERDVAVVGTYLNASDSSSTKMTSFQAIDEIQISLQRLYNMSSSKYFSSSAYNLFSYIGLNTLNDIVAKNLEITDLFIESVERERDLLHLTMILEITILPFLTP